MATLDILVPHWDEGPAEMEPLLGSLALQQGADLSEVRVVVAYDGPDARPLPEAEWRGRYPFAIEFVHAPKGGVSATRNAAYDASDGELVMWCDADDMFYSATGVHIIQQQHELRDYDVLISTFMEQTKGELEKIDGIADVRSSLSGHICADGQSIRLVGFGQGCTYRIYNASGQFVAQGQTAATTVVSPVIRRGMYIIAVSNQQGATLQRKIIVE